MKYPFLPDPTMLRTRVDQRSRANSYWIFPLNVKLWNVDGITNAYLEPLLLVKLLE